MVIERKFSNLLQFERERIEKGKGRKGQGKL